MSRSDSRPAPVIRGSRRRALAVALGVLAACAAVGDAAAHTTGGFVLPEPTFADYLLDWSFDPTVQLPILVAVLGWLFAVRRVNAAHPGSPVPRARSIAFGAGIVAVEVALQSGIGLYDDTLFLDHMIQHLLLTMVAAPLFALSAPITLVLRFARPHVRRGVVLPILHSRVIRFVAHPIVAWLVFTGVMWGTHFSPVFDLSLTNNFVHDLEHVAFLVSAFLFWWPAVGADPGPWRMAFPVRILYVILQMFQNSFLGVAILSASQPLYPHYVTLGRTWGPSPLADQQAAGGFMWVAGDMMLLLAILILVAAWMQADERQARILDARIDAEEAAAAARDLTQPGIGAASSAR